LVLGVEAEATPPPDARRFGLEIALATCLEARVQATKKRESVIPTRTELRSVAEE
jgi:hypothetical protein